MLKYYYLLSLLLRRSAIFFFQFFVKALLRMSHFKVLPKILQIILLLHLNISVKFERNFIII